MHEKQQEHHQLSKFLRVWNGDKLEKNLKLNQTK